MSKIQKLLDEVNEEFYNLFKTKIPDGAYGLGYRDGIRHALAGLPCNRASYGEMTYECDVDKPCNGCRYRLELEKELDKLENGRQGRR